MIDQYNRILCNWLVKKADLYIDLKQSPRYTVKWKRVKASAHTHTHTYLKSHSNAEYLWKETQ